MQEKKVAVSTIESLHLFGLNLIRLFAKNTSGVATKIESKLGLYRFVLFFVIAIWGLWIVSPWWSSFDTTPTFRVMAAFVDEWMWGVLFAFVGIFGLYATGLGAFRASQNAMAFAAILWCVVSGTFIASNIFSTASVIYPSMALLCCVNYYLVELKGALTDD